MTRKDFPSIVFIGAHIEALRPFQHLIDLGADVLGLVTLAPKSLARMSGGVDLRGPANAAGIPVQEAASVNTPESLAWIQSLNPNLLLVVGWTQLLKPELLSVPQIAALGFHASLLPKYRGRAPINWAIINGETETGNTLMVLESGADEGDIVSQRRIPITEDDDCATLYHKVSLTECDMLDEVLPLISKGCMPRIKQDSRQSTVMPKRRPKDGIIDWSWSSRHLYNWIRALTHPYPGAFTHLLGQKISIWKASLEVPIRPLTMPVGSVQRSCDGYPLVVTGDGLLKLLRVSCEDQAPVSGVEAAQTFLTPPVTFENPFTTVPG